MPAIANLVTPELAGMLESSEQPQQATFLGELAKTANKKMLDVARKMAEGKADPTDIWNSTGWFKGADGKWRFEVQDRPSGFKIDPTQEESTRLGFAYRHPKLFEAYPELADIPLTLRTFANPKTGGAYIPPIYGGPSIELNRQWTPAASRSSLLHELQHGIQNIEDFAKGGNTTVTQESAKLQPLALSPWAVGEVSGLKGPASPEQYQSYMLMRAQAHPTFAARENYLRQGGEVESRNVEKRRGWTKEQLKVTPPWMSQSVPNPYQILNLNLPGQPVRPPGVPPWPTPIDYLDTSLLRTRY